MQSVNSMFFRRNEFQLTDSVQYFLNNIDRISSFEYVPTLQDILYCRKTTKGVIETRIEIDRWVSRWRLTSSWINFYSTLQGSLPVCGRRRPEDPETEMVPMLWLSHKYPLHGLDLWVRPGSSGGQKNQSSSGIEEHLSDDCQQHNIWEYICHLIPEQSRPPRAKSSSQQHHPLLSRVQVSSKFCILNEDMSQMNTFQRHHCSPRVCTWFHRRP